MNWLNRVLDLAHIRQTLVYADCTRRHLLAYAERLALPDRPHEILSVSYVANRMTSLKLEPDQHPIVGDTPSVSGMAMLAIARRSDVSWPMRLMFRLWFTFMMVAPKSLANRSPKSSSSLKGGSDSITGWERYTSGQAT